MSNIAIILNSEITENDLIPYYDNYPNREGSLQYIKSILDDLIVNKSHTEQAIIDSTSINEQLAESKLIIRAAENTYNLVRNKSPKLDLWYSLCNRTSFDIENAHNAINKALDKVFQLHKNYCSKFSHDIGTDTYSSLVELQGATYDDVIEQAAYIANILSDFEEGNILTHSGHIKLLPKLLS